MFWNAAADMDESQWREERKASYGRLRCKTLRDGGFVDVSDMAQEAGICVPTFLSEAVWRSCVMIASDPSGCQLEARLWYLLMKVYIGFWQQAPAESAVSFVVAVQDGKGKPKEFTLKAVCQGLAKESVIAVRIFDEN